MLWLPGRLRACESSIGVSHVRAHSEENAIQRWHTECMQQDVESNRSAK